MKSILLSIKPKWVAKILNGEKTIEVRKTMPKCDLPIDVYIYCTKDDDLGRINDFPNKYFVDCVETPQDFEKMDSAYNGKGKVVAKFRCYKVEEIKYSPESDWYFAIKKGIINETTMGDDKICKNACLSHDELSQYLKGKKGYAIHISDLEIFDKPKELSEFNRYHEKKDEHSACWTCKRFGTGCMSCKLTKAPQNYCYIETEK